MVTLKQLRNICLYADLEPRGYYPSARGAHCLGIAGESAAQISELLIEANNDVSELEIDELIPWSDFAEFVRVAKEDSLGRGVIVYWPQISWE